FLEAEVFFTDESRYHALHSRLCSKSLNKHMYIPWSSAHPEAMQHSIVKPEVTCYMILSSKKSYFEKCKKMFFINLVPRGSWHQK
ncbi:hypothetical protein BDD12DRAFT_762683, partial [Trichophaea hybrida]